MVKRFKYHSSALKQNDQMAVYAVNIALFRSWIIKSYQSFFQQIFNSDSENLDFTKDIGTYGSDLKIEKKVQKLKYKTLFFVKNLKEITTTQFPYPLTLFLSEYASHGAYINDEFVTSYEKSRIYFDKYNTLYNVTAESKKFMILYLCMGKIIINFILINPEAFNVKVRKRTMVNLKMIASVLYFCMIEILDTLLEVKEDSEEHEEPLSKNLYTREELEYLYEMHSDFLFECKKHIKEWVELLITQLKPVKDKLSQKKALSLQNTTSL